MLKKFLFLLLSFFLSENFYGQNNPILISGEVFSNSENKPLPYTNIFNKSSNKGTITDQKGYFELELNSYSDSVLVSFIGYEDQYIVLSSGNQFYRIELKESILKLNEVEIKAIDYSYLIDLIISCKEKQSQQIHTAKTYYQLKSYINNRQIELVENFYNAEIQGYDLKKLALKSGRIGLRKTNNRLFLSLESSMAISMHKLFGFSSWFPINPLPLKKKKIKKKFYVDLLKEYLNASKDTIVVIKLSPKTEPRLSFETTVWINKRKFQIIKVDFRGKQLIKFPFVPLFKDDRLEEMNIRFTKTFTEVSNEMVLNHVDFDYDFKYVSRNKEEYHVKTQALIQAYDFENLFHIPFFKFPVSNLNDYQKIDALPYNQFFWENNDELMMTEEIDSNKLFLNDTLTFKQQDLFNKKERTGIKLLEQPYVEWSTKRVIFKQKLEFDSSKMPQSFGLKAKIFLDYNHYNGKKDFYSLTLLDPFDSYFKMELDSLGQAFINIYFDLIEIERRRMMSEIINTDLSIKPIEQIYSETIIRIKNLEAEYFIKCRLGENQKAMKFYNNETHKVTGIDNIKLFQLYLPHDY